MRTAGLLVSVLLLPWISGAQESSGGADFSAMDSDENGVVTEEEFLAYHMAQLKRAFVALDANQDSNLVPSELGTPVATESGMRFQIPRLITVKPERGIHPAKAKAIGGTRGPTGPMSRRISR
ncbi:MAG: hypothetical protein AAF191_07880 [Verrucomicrobiota bacterium]